ncbi:MAG: RHS repeat domain-containing protein [Bacteroidota bacterium]
MATGTPTVSVPLTAIGGRSLSLQLSLSYYASGVRVDDVPSWVGLGWSLNAGGAITRTIRGLADDSYDGWVETSDDLYEFLDSCEVYTSQACNDYVNWVKSGLKDPQPDEFFFNFAGQSGKFVLDSTGTAFTIPNNRMKIEYEIGLYDGPYNSLPNTGILVAAMRCIKYFKVTNIDGTQYFFEKKEITVDTLANDIDPYVSSWFLTRIVNADQTDEIRISYKAENLVMRSRNSQNKPLVSTSFVANGDPSGAFSICQPSTLETSRKIITNTYGWNVDSIITSRDIVVMEDSVRQDLKHAKTLSSQGKKLKKIKLYKIGGALDQEVVFTYMDTKSRMYLKEVQLIGHDGTSQNPYSFTYYQPQNLPDPVWTIAQANDPLGNQNGVDFWGYYNGQSQNSLIPTTRIKLINGKEQVYPGADRRVYEDHAKSGILTRIDYPTGGFTSFSFESNRLSRIAGIKKWDDSIHPNGAFNYINREDTLFNQMDTSFTVQSLISNPGTYVPGSGAIVQTDTFSTTPGSLFYLHDNPDYQIPTKVNLEFDSFYPESADFLSNNYGRIVIKDITDPNNIVTIDSIDAFQVIYSDLIEPGIITGDTCFIEHDRDDWFILSSGKYEIKTIFAWDYRTQCNSQVAGILPFPAVKANVSYAKLKEERYILGGGLRVKEVRSNDSTGVNPELVKTYSYVLPSDSTKSSGVLSNPQRFFFVYSGPDCYYVNAFNSSQVTLGTTGGSQISYSYVTETQNNGEIGKTAYTYNTAWDSPDELTCSFGTSQAGLNTSDGLMGYTYDPCDLVYAPLTSHSWRRGDLLKTEVFDATDNLLRESINTYAFSSDINNSLASVSDTIRNLYMHFFPETNGTKQGIFVDYEYSTGFKYIAQTVEHVYDDPVDTFTVVNNFYYNNPNHLLMNQSIQTNSDGRIVDTRFKYPYDYQAGLVFGNGSIMPLDSLIQQHQLSTLIENQIWEGTSLSPNLVSSQLNVYKNINSGSGLAVIRPSKILSFRSNTPVSATTLNEGVNGNGEYTAIIPNTSYYEEAYELAYELSRGAIVSEKKTDGTPNAYVWGYDYTLPLAQAIGAEPGNIAFTSFEDSIINNTLGNWVLGTGATVGTGGKAGSSQLTTGSISFTPSTSGSYIVSYWQNGSYVETTYEGAGPITLNSPVDEARVYPADAQMTTYTYDRQLRLIATSDVNNIYSFYEYDGLGRLVEVRDQKGNILQQYTYNYKN